MKVLKTKQNISAHIALAYLGGLRTKMPNIIALSRLWKTVLTVCLICLTTAI